MIQLRSLAALRDDDLALRDDGLCGDSRESDTLGSPLPGCVDSRLPGRLRVARRVLQVGIAGRKFLRGVRGRVL
jgi:hypothetical protein